MVLVSDDERELVSLRYTPESAGKRIPLNSKFKRMSECQRADGQNKQDALGSLSVSRSRFAPWAFEMKKGLQRRDATPGTGDEEDYRPPREAGKIF